MEKDVIIITAPKESVSKGKTSKADTSTRILHKGRFGSPPFLPSAACGLQHYLSSRLASSRSYNASVTSFFARKKYFYHLSYHTGFPTLDDKNKQTETFK